jgi:ribosome-associated protein
LAKTLAKKSATADKKTSTSKKSSTPAKKTASKKATTKRVETSKATPSKKTTTPTKKSSASAKAKTSKKAPIELVNEVAKKAKHALPPTKKATKVKKTSLDKGNRSKLTQEGDAERLLSAVIEGLQDMKAVNIVSIDLRSIEDAVANYFVICEGEATTHIKGIANNVEDKVMKAVGEKPWHIEGMENLEWVVVDYVNVVLHIFRRESRLFYQLEDLWTDGVRTEH